MKEAGYGPDKRLKIKVSTRNIATFRDPAVILIDQLKQIYVDGELEVIDTAVYYNRVFKKDYVGGAEPHRHRRSTIPTSPSSRAMPAARCATTTTTAIRR